MPAIVAYFIVAAAKNGERDPGRLYQQVLADYGVPDTSMLFIGVSDPLPCPCLRCCHALGVIKSPVPPQSRAFSLLCRTGDGLFRFKLSVWTNYDNTRALEL